MKYWLKSIGALVGFLLLSLLKGWLGLFLVMLVLPALLVVYVMLFAAGHNQPALLRRSWWPVTVLALGAAFVCPGLTDEETQSTAFSVISAREGSAVYRVAELMTLLLLALAMASAIFALVVLIKAGRTARRASQTA